MKYAIYPCPAGKLLLGSVNGYIQTVSFVTPGEPLPAMTRNDPVLEQGLSFLARYFRGEQPSLSDVPVRMDGTPFQKKVWDELRKIPYGEIRTYKEIAERISPARPAYQATGQAVRANPLAVLVPCHRVIGQNGRLTGYRYGLEKKAYLLVHEGHDPAEFPDFPNENPHR